MSTQDENDSGNTSDMLVEGEEPTEEEDSSKALPSIVPVWIVMVLGFIALAIWISTIQTSSSYFVVAPVTTPVVFNIDNSPKYWPGWKTVFAGAKTTNIVASQVGNVVILTLKSFSVWNSAMSGNWLNSADLSFATLGVPPPPASDGSSGITTVIARGTSFVSGESADYGDIIGRLTNTYTSSTATWVITVGIASVPPDPSGQVQMTYFPTEYNGSGGNGPVTFYDLTFVYTV